MFGGEEGSSFKYWFAHWCAYQMTALNLKAWKFKYLFHDIEKPLMKVLLGGNLERLQRFHGRHNSHHTEYKGGVYKIDYEALIIDLECARFTKEWAPRKACEMLDMEVDTLKKIGTSNLDIWYYRNEFQNTLKKLNLLPKNDK